MVKPVSLSEPRRSYIGQRFGSWLVLSRGDNARSGATRWCCQCDCGTISLVNQAHLIRGFSTSCGCVRNRNLRARRFRGCGDIHLSFYSNIKNRATNVYGGRQAMAFTVTIEYLWALFLEQNRCCALSGLPLQFAPTTSDHDRHQGNASLDRIDNVKGYVPGNVQWVHKHLNYMKRTYDQAYFIEMCRPVSHHNYLENV